MENREDSISIQLLTNMIQNLEGDVSEIKTIAKDTNQTIGEIVVEFKLHEKRITDLEEYNKSKEEKFKWKFSTYIAIASVIVTALALLPYFLDKLL